MLGVLDRLKLKSYSSDMKYNGKQTGWLYPGTPITMIPGTANGVGGKVLVGYNAPAVSKHGSHTAWVDIDDIEFN